MNIDKYEITLRGTVERHDGDAVVKLLPGYKVVTDIDHEQALAEKDREISQLTQSIEMLRYALQGSQDQCQQLMEQAIELAESITKAKGMFGLVDADVKCNKFLMQPGVQAFLKERT